MMNDRARMLLIKAYVNAVFMHLEYMGVEAYLPPVKFGEVGFYILADDISRIAHTTFRMGQSPRMAALYVCGPILGAYKNAMKNVVRH